FAGGRPLSGRAHRRQLRAALPDRVRPARGTDWRGASSARQSRTRATGARTADAGGSDSTLGTAGSRRLPRVRVSRPGAPPASAGRPLSRSRQLPYPLETATGPPSDRSELFGTALDDGKAARPRTQTVTRRRQPARSGASAVG